MEKGGGGLPAKFFVTVLNLCLVSVSSDVYLLVVFDWRWDTFCWKKIKSSNVIKDLIKFNFFGPRSLFLFCVLVCVNDP